MHKGPSIELFLKMKLLSLILNAEVFKRIHMKYFNGSRVLKMANRERIGYHATIEISSSFFSLQRRNGSIRNFRAVIG